MATREPANLEFVNDALQNTDQNFLSSSTSLRKTMAASPYFTEQPGLAAAIASGHPSDDQLSQIGQLVSGLELEKRVTLAGQTGGHLNLSYEQKRNLDAMGVSYDHVDQESIQQAAAEKASQQAKAKKKQQKAQKAQGESVAAGGSSHGSIFGSIGHAVSSAAHTLASPVLNSQIKSVAGDVADKVGNATNVIVDNPVVRPVLSGLDKAAEVAGTPERLGGASSVLGLVNPGLVDTKQQAVDTAENRDSMAAKGYDPSSFFDEVKFYSHGEQVYRDTSALRREYGDEAVENAKEYSTLANDGKLDEYVNDPSLDPDTYVSRMQSLNNPKFQELVDKIGDHHASAGRDFARTAGLQPGSKGFSATSGAVDGLVSWFSDPALAAGKVVSAARYSRVALDSMADTEGVRRVMGSNKAVQNGWQSLLDDASVMRDGDQAQAAAALARVRARTPALVPLLPEINGGTRIVGMAAHGKPILGGAPITNLDDLTEYLTSTNGLLRVNLGKAAREGAYMPGSISRFGYRAIKAKAASGVSKYGSKRLDKLNVSTSPWRFIPTPGEAVNVGMAEQAGREALNYRRFGIGEPTGAGDKVKAWATGKATRARFVGTAKRLMNISPKTGVIDHTAGSSVEQVRRIAATFLPQTTARTLSAQYAASDIAGKRQIFKGLQEQLIHAAGLESTATGKELASRMRADLASADKHRYSADSNLDTITDENGTRRVALHDGQLNTGSWVPSFQEMHKLAAKASVYDYTARGVMESAAMDRILRGVRLGWITTPSGAERNALDEIAGFSLRSSPKEYFKSLSAANQAGLERKVLESQISEQDLEQVRSGTMAYTKATVLAHLRSSRLAGWQKLNKFNEADRLKTANALFKRGEAERYTAEIQGINHRALTSLQVPTSEDTIEDIVAHGHQPAKIGWKLQGYKSIEANGMAGANAWIGNLAQRFTDSGMGQKLLNIVEDDSPETRRAALMHMVGSKEMSQWREYSEVMRPWKDKSLPIAARRQAVADVIDRQVRDIAPLVSDTEGNVNGQLVKYLREHNAPPSAAWLEKNVPDAARPAQVITRDYVPLGADGNSLSSTLGSAASRAYETVVTKPINLISRNPIFLSNYMRSDKELTGVKDAWIAAGVKPEIADQMAAEAVAQRAFEYTTKMVDNPEVASQFSVLSRNFFNFTRAAEDWGRRWGRTFVEDPTRVRKAQLAYEGGVHAGMIQYDSDGNAMFVYPGSGFMIQSMLAAAKAVGIPGIAMVPATPNLTTKVMFLNASLDNPAQLTVSPVFSIPLRIIGQHTDAHQLGMQQFQKIAFGAQGTRSGGGIWNDLQDLMPTSVGRFTKLLDQNDKDSQYASAYKSTLANLAAAGLIPKPDASAKDMQNFKDRLKTGVLNQLTVRAVTSLFLPASPSQPENTVPGKTDADAVYRAQGIRTLKDEYRVILNTYGPTNAMAIWTKLHPDQLAYTIGQSDTDVATALPATKKTMEWMEGNLPSLQKYGVSAYFIPQDKGKYSQQAYNAQLQLGMRHRKSTDQFYDDIVTQHAESIYYSSKDSYDAELAKATAAGDDGRAKNLRAAWSQWSSEFRATNPLFAEKQANWGARTVERQQSLGELQDMMNDPKGRSVVPAAQRGIVQNLLDSYHSYTSWYDANGSKRDKNTTAQKQAVQAGYSQHLRDVMKAHPNLQPLVNGLFRLPGTELDVSGSD